MKIDEIKNSSFRNLFLCVYKNGSIGSDVEKLDEFLEKCPSFTEEKLNEFMGEKWTYGDEINLFKKIMDFVKGIPESEREALYDIRCKLMSTLDKVYNSDSIGENNAKNIQNDIRGLMRNISLMEDEILLNGNEKKLDDAENKKEFGRALGELLCFDNNRTNTPNALVYNANSANFAKRIPIMEALGDFVDETNKNMENKTNNSFITDIFERDVWSNEYTIDNLAFEPDENQRGVLAYASIVRFVVGELIYDLFETPVKDYIEAGVLDEKEFENFVIPKKNIKTKN